MARPIQQNKELSELRNGGSAKCEPTQWGGCKTGAVVYGRAVVFLPKKSGRCRPPWPTEMPTAQSHMRVGHRNHFGSDYNFSV